MKRKINRQKRVKCLTNENEKEAIITTQKTILSTQSLFYYLAEKLMKLALNKSTENQQTLYYSKTITLFDKNRSRSFQKVDSNINMAMCVCIEWQSHHFPNVQRRFSFALDQVFICNLKIDWHKWLCVQLLWLRRRMNRTSLLFPLLFKVTSFRSFLKLIFQTGSWQVKVDCFHLINDKCQYKMNRKSTTKQNDVNESTKIEIDHNEENK